MRIDSRSARTKRGGRDDTDARSDLASSGILLRRVAPLDQCDRDWLSG